MQEQSKYENTAYVALWGLLFAAPLLSLYIRTINDSSLTFNWQEVWLIWRHFWVYLLIFVVHNFILAPLLIFRHKRWLYALLTACMIGAFAFYQCSNKPDHIRRHQPHNMEMHEPGPIGDRFGHEPPPEFRGEKFDRRPPAFIGEHDIVAIVIVILMCGMNLGIKLYFKFMNTLNNIHALVDIDPEKAKDTILELSKMMRFVLYEGDKKGVPLSREFDFIRHYVTLMQLRYTDKVRISVDLPQEAPDKQIPPLMLITFIENAFKHGISYQHESFIDVKVAVNDKLHFTCRNSKADKPNEEKGGVGLKNVKQRLNLLYDNNYTLNIQDEPDVYHVELTIPLL